MVINNFINRLIENFKSEDYEFDKIIENSITEHLNISNHMYYVAFHKLETYINNVKLWEDSKKYKFILYLIKKIKPLNKSYKTSQDKNYQILEISVQYIKKILSSPILLSETEIVTLFNIFENKRFTFSDDYRVVIPLKLYLNVIEYNFNNKSLPKDIIDILEDLLKFERNYDIEQKEFLKLKEKIKSYIQQVRINKEATIEILFLGDDGFTKFANSLIYELDYTEKTIWYKILELAQSAKGSQPNAKFIKNSTNLLNELGDDKFKEITNKWFDFIIKLKETTNQHTYHYNGNTYNAISVDFLDSVNSEAIKGLVWIYSTVLKDTDLQLIVDLTEKSFKKIPQKGPAMLSVGNACLYILYNYNNFKGIAQLSKLKHKIKHSSSITIIEKYLKNASEKLNILPIEIEDQAVDNFDLENLKKSFKLDNYTCNLEIFGIGKTKIEFVKNDGTILKTIPTIIKNNYQNELKEIKNLQKQINQTLITQKERFDRMFRINRTFTIEYFNTNILSHSILSYVIKNLIFKFSNNETSINAIFINNQWKDIKSNNIDIDIFEKVNLWHPVTSSSSEVYEWRYFLLKNEILQPIKQAFREIYTFTDAENITGTYSNRMASHILKQHQFVSLAKVRNWNARLLGSWDGGDDSIAELNINEMNLKVEFHYSSVNLNDEYNDAGIWNYVSTDMVRILDTSTNNPVHLSNIDNITFSEIMRDLDLFVGVSSIGNDPNWIDSGGIPQYRDYWQEYSFGNLSQVAKNRKELLENVLSKLKIASVAHIEGNFLIVRGKLRTYKIHIGSTNILMEPNDQYLCIVPDSKIKNTNDNVFLPFEGDSGYSIIISKAILLANDDKITDTTITSQINRK